MESNEHIENNNLSKLINIDDLINNFHTKKIYIDILQFIKNHNVKNKNSDFKAHHLFIKVHFQNNSIHQDLINKLLEDLTNSGLLGFHSGNYFVTEKGKSHLENYHLFKIKGKVAKCSELVEKNLKGLMIIFAVAISVLSLTVSIVTLCLKH